MVILFIILIVIIAAVLAFMRTAVFGTLSTGKRLQRIEVSPNYSRGQFQNKSFTPNLKEGTRWTEVLSNFFFNRSPRNKPGQPLPAQYTNLHELNPEENVLVWFGHSSYFFQVDGKRFLVDPVLSGHASPVPGFTKAFPATHTYTSQDIPTVDYLLLTHDHYDHLDYETIKDIKDRVGQVVTGLGTGAHLERWGYEPGRVQELDWEETVSLAEGFRITAMPARHFSGRTFKRNTSIWLSLVLQTPSMNLYLGGDSGYDSHFQTIGEKFGPFDLAILECGQYNEYWKYIHMMPEEVVQAGIDLKARMILPVHWAKFALALHAWDEPIRRASAAAARQGLPVLTPMMGQKLVLNSPQRTTSWWEGIA